MKFNLNLKLAVVPKEKKTNVRVSNKIVYGTVIKKDGVYKVSIDKDKNGVKTEEILDFTPDSFDVTGKTNVFLRTKDEHGNNVRIIRSEWDAKFHPGTSDKYIPFVENWIVKGYIVKNGIVRLFDFKDLVGIDGYTMMPHDEEI